MQQVQCPKCRNYKSCLVGLREAELLIVLGILLMVFAFFRAQFWYLPIIAFVAAVIFYIPALSQHYRCKKCGHRWNAKKERTGLKWKKRKEGPDGDYHL